MPKFAVSHSEEVSYEPVIIEAPDAEAAEDIVRQSDPRDFDASHEEGNDYHVEAVEADADDLKRYREVEVKGDQVVPFKDEAKTDERRAEIAEAVRSVLRTLMNDAGDDRLLSRDDIEAAALDCAEKIINLKA